LHGVGSIRRKEEEHLNRIEAVQIEDFVVVIKRYDVKQMIK